MTATVITSDEVEDKKDLAQNKILEYARRNCINHYQTLKIIKDWQDSKNESDFLSRYLNDPEKLEIANAVLELRKA